MTLVGGEYDALSVALRSLTPVDMVQVGEMKEKEKRFDKQNERVVEAY